MSDTVPYFYAWGDQLREIPAGLDPRNPCGAPIDPNTVCVKVKDYEDLKGVFDLYGTFPSFKWGKEGDPDYVSALVQTQEQAIRLFGALTVSQPANAVQWVSATGDDDIVAYITDQSQRTRFYAVMRATRFLNPATLEAMGKLSGEDIQRGLAIAQLLPYLKGAI